MRGRKNPWRRESAPDVDDAAVVDALFDHVPGLRCIIDSDGHIVRISADWTGITGVDASSAVGQRLHDLLPSTNCRGGRADLAHALTSGAHERLECEHRSASGRTLYLRWSLQPLDGVTLLVAHDLTTTLEADERSRQQVEARARSEHFFQTVVDAQSDLIVRVDAEHRFTFVNDAYCRTFGKTREQLLGHPFAPLVHEADLPSTMAAMARLHEPPHRCTLEQRAWTVDGWRWIAWDDVAFVDAAGAIVEIQGVGRDITALKAIESQARDQVLREREIIALADVARWDFDYRTQRLTWSAAAHALFETDPTRFIPTYEGFVSLVHPLDRDHVTRANEIAVRERAPLDIEHRIVTARGRLRWVQQRATVSVGADGQPERAVGVIQDISQRKLYDPLTGLATVQLLQERLDTAISAARAQGTVVALCSIDLDRFADVNERYGRSTGDDLLVHVAKRLDDTLRRHDLAVRVAGDEFVVLLTMLRSADEAQPAAARLVEELQRPFVLDAATVEIGASIGVAIHPLDDTPTDTLRRQADQAMQAAKVSANERLVVYDQATERERRARVERRVRIAQALQGDEMVLHFQPTIDLRSGAISGAEALVRWQHPSEGLLPPGRFLPDILDSDLELTLDRWVMARALQQWGAWRRAGTVPADATLGVNVSARALLHPRFVDELRDTLAHQPDAPASALQIEVLESSALNDLDAARDVLARCRSLGVTVALDDFGTGHSSLSHFRVLPTDVVKVDRAFVQGMLDDPDDLGIVTTVVALGQAFNRTVCAEGVETLEQAASLQTLGCHQIQGYVLARPQPAEAFVAWAANWCSARIRDELALHELVPADQLGLLAAARSHAAWAQQVLSFVASAGASALPILDGRHCAFASWYFGSGSARFGDDATYLALEGEHAALHDLAQTLVEQVQRGAVSVEANVEAFTARHRRLLVRLGRLRSTLARGHEGLVSAGPMARASSQEPRR